MIIERPSLLVDYQAVFEELSSEWQAVGLAAAPDLGWDDQLRRMRVEAQSLRARGLWRTGGRTLLHELGLHHSETHLCRGLGWLLTPDGWHGLGDRVLGGVLSHLDLPLEGLDRASVRLEEARDGTRADLIVRLPESTLLIEAKVFAAEQPTQADRLAQEWAEETPTLVFLTRAGYAPHTAVASAGEWQMMTWREVATIAAEAAGDAEPSPGALEFIQTLEAYGG